MDMSLIGRASIDPYLKCDFAGVSLKTRSHSSNRSPVFAQEFHMPVTLPSMTNNIVLRLFDKDMDSVSGGREERKR